MGSEFSHDRSGGGVDGRSQRAPGPGGGTRGELPGTAPAPPAQSEASRRHLQGGGARETTAPLPGRRQENHTRTTTSVMASHNSRKTPRIFIEKKSWFLGRFITRTLTDSSLAKLRAHVRLNKGFKTKLKLTSEGLASGNKSSGILKSKIPYEFTPLSEIKDISTDQVYHNVLLCVFDLTDLQYEITAFRFADETEARLFQHAYYDLAGRPYSVIPRVQPYTLSGAKVPVRAGPEEVYGQAVNWSMRAKPSIYRDDVAHRDGRIYRDGVTYKRPSLSDMMTQRGRSREYRVVTTRGRSASPVTMTYAPDYKTFCDVAVLALLDVSPDSRFKGRPHFSRQNVYHREGVSLSDVSCQVCLPVPSNRAFVNSNGPNMNNNWINGTTGTNRDSMRRHLEELQHEVKHLRAMVTNGNYSNQSNVYKSDLGSDHGYRSNGSNPSNGNHDSGPDSDSSFTSLDTVAKANISNRIDTKVGAVKVLVDDFRRRSRLDRVSSPSKITELTEPDDYVTADVLNGGGNSVRLNTTTDTGSGASSSPVGASVHVPDIVLPTKDRASRMRERSDIMTTSIRHIYNRSVSPHSNSGHYGNRRSRSTESRYKHNRYHDDVRAMDSDGSSGAVARRVEHVHPSRRNRNKADYVMMFPGSKKRSQSASRYETSSDRFLY